MTNENKWRLWRRAFAGLRVDMVPSDIVISISTRYVKANHAGMWLVWEACSPVVCIARIRSFALLLRQNSRTVCTRTVSVTMCTGYSLTAIRVVLHVGHAPFVARRKKLD